MKMYQVNEVQYDLIYTMRDLLKLLHVLRCFAQIEGGTDADSPRECSELVDKQGCPPSKTRFFRRRAHQNGQNKQVSPKEEGDFPPGAFTSPKP